MLVYVEPMIGRVGIRSEYLSDNGDNKNTELIKQRTRTGRPLGSSEFIRELQISTGESRTMINRHSVPRISLL